MSGPHSFKRKKHRRGKRAGRRHRVNHRLPPGIAIVTGDVIQTPTPVSPAVIHSLRKRLAQLAQRRSA